MRAPVVPGLLLTALIASVVTALSAAPAMPPAGRSPLTLALVAGLLLGNSIYPRFGNRLGAGVDLARQRVLRAGVMLYGARLTLGDIAHVGLAGVLVDLFMLCSTLGLGAWLGVRLFRLDRDSSILIAAGSAICGAAAVMATEPVLNARAERVTIAVASVVLLGTAATFLYPLLYSLTPQVSILPQGQWAFGIYAGSTIHEVSQVLAASRSVGMEATNAAVITKMVRVMMLAPFLIALSAWTNRARAGGVDTAFPSRITIPWFAIGFIAVVALNSLWPLPTGLAARCTQIDSFLLAMAMAALGLTTHASSLRRAGLRPILLAVTLFGWLVIAGAAINHLVLQWV